MAIPAKSEMRCDVRAAPLHRSSRASDGRRRSSVGARADAFGRCEATLPNAPAGESLLNSIALFRLRRARRA
jgi:hypothetical protein